MFCCCGTADYFCDEDTVLCNADSNFVCAYRISELFLQDYTPYLETYMNSWEETGIEFDGITTGFIGSKEQIGLVVEFLKNLKKRIHWL